MTQVPPDDDRPWSFEVEIGGPQHTNGQHYPNAPQSALAALEIPTRLEPMRGLTHLAKVALFGRDAILKKAKEPVPYVWQDIAVAGTIILLAGGPGEGKTTLLFLLLVARMNEGEPIKMFGRKIEKAPEGAWTVLLEGEHGEISASRKLLRSCEILSVNDIALQRVIIIARKAVHIGSPEWQDIGRLVAAGLVSDIAIDTVARVAPSDGNSEEAQIAIFDLVAKTIELAPSEATKPIVWAVAHTRKNGTSGDLSDVSGSTQRVGQADTVMLIKGAKDDSGRVVSSTATFAKLREEVDDYPEPVTWSVVKEGATRKLVVVGSKPTDEAPLEERILARLAVSPATANELAKFTIRSWADVQAALSGLFEAKRIRGENGERRGKMVKVFSLRMDPVKVARLWPDSASGPTNPDDDEEPSGH